MSSFLENLSRQIRSGLEEAGKVTKEIGLSIADVAAKLYNEVADEVQEADAIDLFLPYVSVASLANSIGTAFRNRFAPLGSSPLEQAFYQKTNGSKKVIKLSPYLQDDILLSKENKTYSSDATLINGAIYTYQSIVEELDLVKSSGGFFSPFKQEFLGSFIRLAEEETFVTYSVFADSSGAIEARCTTKIIHVSEELSIGQISMTEVAEPKSSTRCAVIDSTK